MLDIAANETVVDSEDGQLVIKNIWLPSHVVASKQGKKKVKVEVIPRFELRSREIPDQNLAC
jgi:hypothetical protein